MCYCFSPPDKLCLAFSVMQVCSWQNFSVNNGIFEQHSLICFQLSNLDLPRYFLIIKFKFKNFGNILHKCFFISLSECSEYASRSLWYQFEVILVILNFHHVQFQFLKNMTCQFFVFSPCPVSHSWLRFLFGGSAGLLQVQEFMPCGLNPACTSHWSWHFILFRIPSLTTQDENCSSLLVDSK